MWLLQCRKLLPRALPGMVHTFSCRKKRPWRRKPALLASLRASPFLFCMLQFPSVLAMPPSRRKEIEARRLCLRSCLALRPCTQCLRVPLLSRLHLQPLQNRSFPRLLLFPKAYALLLLLLQLRPPITIKERLNDPLKNRVL